MENLNLYMLLLGCKPPGRHTEQHDVFFGIAASLKELVPEIYACWPEAKSNIHIDAWRKVTSVDGYNVKISEKDPASETGAAASALFFLNLGGYKPNEFEEYHYKMLAVAENESAAIKAAKATAFYKHTGFKGASSHIDDNYLLDVDNLYKVSDILPAAYTGKYSIELLKQEIALPEDELQLGFLQLWKIKD